MPEPHEIDELFDQLGRIIRMRDRAVHTTLRTAEGVLETAALKALFPLMKQPMRSRELASSLSADPSTVSRHVAQLVDSGLVERQADPVDGRATLLVITDDGRDRAMAMRVARRDASREALSDWTDAEFTSLVSLFRRFVDAMDTVVPSPCELRTH